MTTKTVPDTFSLPTTMRRIVAILLFLILLCVDIHALPTTGDSDSGSRWTRSDSAESLFRLDFGVTPEQIPGDSHYPFGIVSGSKSTLILNDYSSLLEVSTSGDILTRVSCDKYAGDAMSVAGKRYVVLSQAGVVTEKREGDGGRVLLTVDKRKPVLCLYDLETKNWRTVEVTKPIASTYPLRFGGGSVGALAENESKPVKMPGLEIDDSIAPPMRGLVGVRFLVGDDSRGLQVITKSTSGEGEDLRHFIATDRSLVVREVRPLAQDDLKSYYTLKYSYNDDSASYRIAVLCIDADGTPQVFASKRNIEYPIYCSQPLAYVGSGNVVQMVISDGKLIIEKWELK